MNGLVLLPVGLFVSLSFVIFIHFIVAPLVKNLYWRYEPIMFHYKFKLVCRLKKLRKVIEKFIKTIRKGMYFTLRKVRF
jgi:hypothetical protein